MDNARFNFETTTQDWQDLTGARVSGHVAQAPVVSNAHVYAGNQALAFHMAVSTAQDRVVGAVGDAIGGLVPGTVVTYRLWVPAGHGIERADAFMQTRTGGSWTDDGKNASELVEDAWNTFSVVVPQAFGSQMPLELGFLFYVSQPWEGTVWMDSITFE